jgi:hypothetical protein
MLNAKSLLKLSAGLLVLGSIAVAGQAQAQTADIPFNGTIPNACSFSTPVSGTLSQAGTFAAMEGSTGITGLGGGGTAGTVSVTCSSNTGTLSIDAPVRLAAPTTFAPATVQSIVQLGATATLTSAKTGPSYDTAVWNGATTPIALPTGTSNLKVGMVAGVRTAGALPSGPYSYTVKLTVAAN